MKEHECPNCGSASPKILDEGEFQCEHCDTKYVDQAMLERRRAKEKQQAQLKTEEMRANAKEAQAKAVSGAGKRALLFAGVGLVVIFSFVFYMGNKSMDQNQKAQEEIMKTLQQSVDQINAAADTLK